MGMYDEVTLYCPECNAPYHEQSKGGSCTLSHYTIDTLDETILSGMYDDFTCTDCGTVFEVKRIQQPRYVVRRKGLDRDVETG